MKMNFFLIAMLAFLSVAQAQVNETQRLISDDLAAEDYFGSAVAVSGDYAIIGACYDDENGENSGSAYIFYNNSGTWEQYQKITASDGQTNDFFAITVTISGNYAFATSLLGSSNSYAGKVYVFFNDEGIWTETAILTASDGEDYDFFGTSMSISDDYAIIGAYGNDDSGSESGSAYIFHNNEGTWTETTKLTASNGNENDRFGISVGISDDYAIIGADGSANNSGANSGTAYIFYNNLENWEQTQQIESLDAVLGDQFGGSVSISGEYAAIGAEYKSDDGTWSGAAYVFHDNSGIWEQDIKLTASDAGSQKHFGSSISIIGDTLIVGSEGNISFTPYIAGSAYLFKNILDNWQETTILLASDIGSQDQFGYVVDFSDDFAFIGSPRTDTNYEDAGAVYVYYFPFVNNPPIANAGSDQTVTEFDVVQLDGSASYDPDTDPITYLWTAPTGITLSDPTVVNPTFTAPEVFTNDPVDYEFTLVVDDGITRREISEPDIVIITVLNVNLQPIANAGIDQIVDEGNVVTLDGSASSDPDSDPLTYLWTAPTEIELDDPTLVNPTFTTPNVIENTDYIITLIVNDGEYDSEPDSVTITVLWDGVFVDELMPKVTKLLGNYPNPFNPTTTIKYNLNENANIRIEFFNIKGQNVTTLVEQNKDAGYHSVVWNGKDSTGNQVSSGLYLYKLIVDNKAIDMKKCLLLK